MIQRILVGVDGSANSLDALAWAVDLAERLGAEVIAVHAVGLLEAFATHDEATRDVRLRRFESEWCAPLSNSDVARRLLLVDGDPVSALLRTTAEVEADLVVVGSRGVGDRSELLLGSTSTQVIQRSSEPVVVVPAGRSGSSA